jgi:hypothetical protein
MACAANLSRSMAGVVKERMQCRFPETVFELLKGYNFLTKRSTISKWLFLVLDKLQNLLRMLLEYQLLSTVCYEILSYIIQRPILYVSKNIMEIHCF